MMYNFIDTNEQPGALPLPAEAMSFGGVYIENEVTGYRTLYVEGREKISAVIESTEMRVRDGALYRGMRYEPRTLIVGFQLNSASAAAQMAAYNKLLYILSQKQAQIIFADEPDKYYTGTKTKITNTPPGRLAVTGEIEIFCADPFKYSIQEYEVEDTNGEITVNYGGTYPAHPKFTAVSEDHDCGFYSFVHNSGASVQVGDPEETDSAEIHHTDDVTVVLDYRMGSSHESADYSTDNNYWKRSEKRTPYYQYTQTNDVAQKEYYLYPVCPDNTSQYNYYFGPCLGHTFTEVEGTHENFILTAINKMTIPDPGIGFGFDFYVIDTDDSPMCGFSIRHNIREKIKWELLGPSGVLKTYSAEVASNPFSSWTEQKITKIGSTLTFVVGGKTFSVDVPEIEFKEANNLSFALYYQPGTVREAMNNNLNWVAFRSIPSTWVEVENKIPTGGVVEVDTGSGDIKLNGTVSDDLGTVDNDFEGFVLDYGSNTVTCSASDWVLDAAYTMKYREVYL